MIPMATRPDLKRLLFFAYAINMLAGVLFGLWTFVLAVAGNQSASILAKVSLALASLLAMVLMTRQVLYMYSEKYSISLRYVLLSLVFTILITATSFLSPSCDSDKDCEPVANSSIYSFTAYCCAAIIYAFLEAMVYQKPKSVEVIQADSPDLPDVVCIKGLNYKPVSVVQHQQQQSPDGVEVTVASKTSFSPDAKGINTAGSTLSSIAAQHDLLPKLECPVNTKSAIRDSDTRQINISSAFKRFKDWAFAPRCYCTTNPSFQCNYCDPSRRNILNHVDGF
ncbi:hypothetical protein PoB_004375300 [Plakobranchus ocellatus]|uniref:MARVEL domain-containing protein n=1 Tax=Plakobranchus ocellatus TaxID=259542 RepID=A0AAV4BEG9_9GAST|nr:hypothetical protein PoB_004375300 [Plakobranchus ocellatus]